MHSITTSKKMDFVELIKSNPKDAYALLTQKDGVENSAKEFNNDRSVRETQVGKRQDKTVTTKTGSDTVKVAKIPIPFQRQIVKTAATFLFGSPVKLVEKKSIDKEDKDGEAFQNIIDTWDALRIDSLLLKFCKTVKSETEASIVFFSALDPTDNKPKLRARVLTNENGKVYPVFDAFGDMVAFNWEYTAKEDGKEVSYWYAWTNENMYAFSKAGSDWAPLEKFPQKNLFLKIPVVYMSQTNPEWWEVQDLIDTFEMSFSKFVDTNGYFASPMYKVKGAVASMPKKDETGKMVKLDIVETDKGNIIEADIDVISWDRAPEALKLEFETEKELIYGLSNTPDLSFDNVKGIGNVSGIALKLMFLGAILKAKEVEGEFRIAISRIINILIAGISNITNTGLKAKLAELKVDITFTSILPENTKEIIEMLAEATAGKAVMSQKTAIGHNPLVDDVDEEMINIENENNADSTFGLGETEV